MTHSLYYKFLLGYLAFLFLGFLTISTVSSKMVERYLVESSAQTLYDEANLIASSYSSIYKGTNLDLSAAYPQMQAVGSFLGARIWVVDDSGSIVLDSDGSAHTGTVIEDFDPVGDGNESYSVGRYYGLFNSDVLSVSAPITGNFNTYGYVVIHLPMTEVEDGKNEILLLIYLSGAFIFLLSLIILLIFTKTVYFPLKKITYGANEYADGNLKYNIDLKTSDEMGYLAATLDYMSDELEKMEEYQRRFIANVSHDFRSPLTSIKGYVEAIIDGTVPRELEAKYLNIVISETERLNKLTEGMLTLNSLDSKGYLSRSNFDINRVIKDTAASFEGTCNAKDIIIDLTFSDTTQMVYADLGKIQQVLYNLIDNAIKSSPNNSVIYIHTGTKYEKVFVSVKDNGIGIPKADIMKIWDRFYKTDLSRGKDKKGTGLGLAIVKEIIQAHGENIDVISTVDVGTEFRFSLPKSTNL